jgi:hypothetical protein
MHKRTLDIHQEEANISNLFFAPLMIHDLPTYLRRSGGIVQIYDWYPHFWHP